MKNIVHNKKCEDFMINVPDKFYDLGIVDPPYGINVDKKMTGYAKNWNTGQDEKKWDQQKPGDEYFKELFRITKNQIIFGANYFFEHLPSSSGSAIWDKNNGSTFFADYELIYISSATSNRKFKMCISQYNRKEKRIHKTQKPTAIYKWLLNHHSKKGFKIFDSHVGSGSIRLACYDLNLYFEGTEIDPDYWEEQEKRFLDYVSSEKEQKSIFQKTELNDLFYQGEII